MVARSHPTACRRTFERFVPHWNWVTTLISLPTRGQATISAPPTILPKPNLPTAGTGTGPGEKPAATKAGAAQALNGLSHISTTPDQRIPPYARTAFGPAWADVDHNGCDTRDDILARDLRNITRAGDGCTVLSGNLADPYTGKSNVFTRGVATSTKVQVDHRYPLSAAWSAGAWSWSDQQRERFANDPLELVAADGPANEAKGDSGPADWVPSNAAYACTYDNAFVQVAAKYDLTVSAADRSSLTRTLTTCAR
ncbi:HNH endonuclease family protein [Curtobacterium sp. PsM8]|nr:HNH endonuclease family protein [Curtobacterium sp. PsM8]